LDDAASGTWQLWLEKPGIMIAEANDGPTTSFSSESSFEGKGDIKGSRFPIIIIIVRLHFLHCIQE